MFLKILIQKPNSCVGNVFSRSIYTCAENGDILGAITGVAGLKDDLAIER
jgi:hypothetical protein